MRNILIISLLLFAICVDAQTTTNRTSLKRGLQKCLDLIGNPIENCFVTTDANGEQMYIDSATMAGMFGDADWYRSGALIPNDITQDIYRTGNVHIGDASMSLSGKLNVSGVFNIDVANLQAINHTYPGGKNLRMGAGTSGSLISTDGSLTFQSASGQAVGFTDGTYSLTFTVEQFANVYRSFAQDNAGTRAFVLRHNPGLTTNGSKMFALDNVFTEVFSVDKDGVVDCSGAIKLTGYTVATLPTGVIGMTAYVTDATAPTYLGVLTGGGAVVCPVFYDGTNWVSH